MKTMLVMALMTVFIPVACAQVQTSSFVGKDIYWRLHEWIIFHVVNDTGRLFSIEVALADMNTYCQGPRPAMIWIVSPEGRTILRHIIEDDGIISGNERYKDGVYDVFSDMRYREYHRANSPGGYPPGKERSPCLSAPETLTYRKVALTVPATTPGVYQVRIVGCYDHWVTLTLSRPMETAVASGPSWLYVHGNTLSSAYLFVPKKTEDLSISICEEIEPFTMRLALCDPRGNQVAEIKPKTFWNYLVQTPKEKGAVYQLKISGTSTNYMLAVTGVPFILAPTAETADKIKGSLIELPDGTTVYHEYQRTLWKYVHGLKPADFELGPAPDMKKYTKELEQEPLQGLKLLQLIQALPYYAALQTTDLNNPLFGKEQQTLYQRDGRSFLFACLAGWKHPANPSYRSRALLNRALLADLPYLLSQDEYHGDGTILSPEADLDRPARIDPAKAPLRTNWYGLGYLGMFLAPTYRNAVSVMDVLPKDIAAAWKTVLMEWVAGRWMMHMGETSNQWTYNLRSIYWLWQGTHDPQLKEMIIRHCIQLTTPGLLGRVNPDPPPKSYKSSAGCGLAADAGLTGPGYLAENYGYDQQYSCEQEANLKDIEQDFRIPEVAAWYQRYDVLKVHIVLPIQGKAENPAAFRNWCTPTHFNSRGASSFRNTPGAPFYLYRDIIYQDYWQRPPAKDEIKKEFETARQEIRRRLATNSVAKTDPTSLRWLEAFVPENQTMEACLSRTMEKADSARHPLPCMEEEPFIRIIDSIFYFVNTRNYYAILYGGPTVPVWSDYWGMLADQGSVRLLSRGGLPTKVGGGLSAVFVKQCGPTLFSINEDVWYNHCLAGRTLQPWQPSHDNKTVFDIVSSSYTSPETTWDEKTRTFCASGNIAHTPIIYKRTTAFQDDQIDHTISCTASENAALKEFFEVIPYMATDQTIKTYDHHFKCTASFAAVGKDGKGPMDDISCRAVDIANEQGVGILILFDKPLIIKQVASVAYASIPSVHIRSLRLPLPGQLTAGESHPLHYTIIPHQQPVTEKFAAFQKLQ
jgi:hypothetical protein